MSDGTKYSPSELTLAANTLPIGSKVIVCNKQTWKCSRAKVTDRLAPRFSNRVDLSAALAKKIGVKGSGKVTVYSDSTQPCSVPELYLGDYKGGWFECVGGKWTEYIPKTKDGK